MIDNLQDCRWSCYLDFIGDRNPPAWLERDFILSYFGKKPSIAQKNYRKFPAVNLSKLAGISMQTHKPCVVLRD